jgi:hypothetical protein
MEYQPQSLQRLSQRHCRGVPRIQGKINRIKNKGTMIQKEITLCGKQVTLAYCYGTEISYKLLADQECTEFVREVLQGLAENKMPDSRKAIYLIMSAMTAYYESKNQENPIEDKELIFHATPDDIGLAVGTIAGLYIEFYKIPVGEPEDKKPANQEEAEKKD